MVGQGNKSDAFPGKFYLGYGPNGINLLRNQNADSSDSSSKEIHPEFNNAPSGNEPSATVLEANSGVPSCCNFDLNIAAYEDDNGISDSQEPGVGGESDTNKNGPDSTDSSNSNTIVISSGIAGYVLEENEGGEDSALGDRRLSCKRRAPEDASRRLFLGESSRSVKQVENLNLPSNSPLSNHPNAGYPGQPGGGGRTTVHMGPAPALHQPSSAAGSGVVAEAGTSSEIYQNSSVAEQAENSQRNIRLRRSTSQSNSVTDNYDLSAWTIRNNPHAVQSPAGRQPVFYQFTNLTGSNTATPPGMVNITSPMQPLMHTPNPSQNLHPFQWNRVTRTRASGSSTDPATTGGNTLLHQDQNSRRNAIFLPEFRRAHMPANLQYANGRNFPGSISQSGSSSHQPPPPSWFPQGSMEEQYPGRMPELVNRSTGPQGQLCYCPFHLRQSHQLQEGSGNISSSQIPLMPGLEIMGERQAATREMAMRALSSAVQRRNRLAIGVRNALAFVRRRGSLQFGNVMLIDGQALFGDSDDDDDELGDMRLDVDNMSYEQLLALEERMGNVSTGLNEDVIVANLKRWRYQVIEDGSDNEDEPCCICQEEYADEDEVGKMRCGHDFHFNCIKRWLVEKNNCPICKKTAADV